MRQAKLDELLSKVDYSIDESYVPSSFALELVNFIKMVNAEEGGEENKSPIFHYKILDTYGSRNKRIISLNFRGSGKSTLMEYMILYAAVYGKVPNWGKQVFWMYVSDSIENGIKNMRRSLQNRWENSAFLRKYIPKVKFTDIRWEFRNVSGSSFVVRGYGASTGVRGAREFNRRPTWALLDDLLDDEGSKSPTIIANIEHMIYKAVTYALHPRRNRILWSGTPFNAKDPLYKAIESKEWMINSFPVAEKFPVPRNQFKGAWEDRFPYEYVKSEYDIALGAGTPESFYRELMLQIISDDDRIITEDDIYWYDKQTLMQNSHQYNFLITTDFATSVNKSADFSVISVWAMDHKKNYYYVDGIIKKQTMNDNIEDLFRLVKTYRPMSVGIEISGQQGGFISWLFEEMNRKNTRFALAKTGKQFGIRPTTDKFTRFQVVEPLFKLGKIHFPESIKKTDLGDEIMTELSLITASGFKSKHDDFIDTVSMLALVNVPRPTGKAVKQPVTTRNYEMESIYGPEFGSTNAENEDYYFV